MTESEEPSGRTVDAVGLEPPKRVVELTDSAIALAYDAMLALRPHIGTADDFVRRVQQQQIGGYRLVAVTAKTGRAALAAAGFRVLESLAWGRCLYVDDLTTLPTARRAGHATALLQWLHREANQLECDALHLDSNIGPQRAAAHRLYLRNGMAITSLHFAKATTTPT